MNKDVSPQILKDKLNKLIYPGKKDQEGESFVAFLRIEIRKPVCVRDAI